MSKCQTRARCSLIASFLMADTEVNSICRPTHSWWKVKWKLCAHRKLKMGRERDGRLARAYRFNLMEMKLLNFMWKIIILLELGGGSLCDFIATPARRRAQSRRGFDDWKIHLALPYFPLVAIEIFLILNTHTHTTDLMPHSIRWNVLRVRFVSRLNKSTERKKSK